MKKVRVLLLNSDYQPVDIISWKKCMTKLFADKPSIYVISHYEDENFVDSKGRNHPAPAIVVSKVFLEVNSRKAPYSKINVFARDEFTCQYCLQKFDSAELTIDHVNPRSKFTNKANATCYENVVTACKACNTYKADIPLGKARYPASPKQKWLKKLAGQLITLHGKAVRPTRSHVFKKKLAHLRIPNEWREYL